jgi:CRISPR-associated protein Csm1
VDNFGQAFLSGFVRQGDSPEQRNKYNTLSRTAALSRQMTIFFKYYLNRILEGKEGYLSLDRHGMERKGKRVVTVYSGGDDLFLIGNFQDILETAIAVQSTFERYTCGSLTISFGIGIYPVKYPLYKAAFETEELEGLAKNNEGKNSISLFSGKEDHTYRFSEFRKKVIDEKLTLLQNFFEPEAAEPGQGNSYLYKILMLLKASNERINIARYAYLLAKLEPQKMGSDRERRANGDFLKRMYEWILSPEDRKALITAIYIYLYLTRKRSDE